MKLDWKKLLISLGIPLAVGGLATLISGSGMAQYGQLYRPPLSPPGWVFPVVWTVLYLLMGYASYLVWTSDALPEDKKNALLLYGAQLLANFLWPIAFFGLEWRLAAFVILLALWALIFLTIRAFSRISEQASDLLLPYILWVTFAAYLNLGAYILN